MFIIVFHDVSLLLKRNTKSEKFNSGGVEKTFQQFEVYVICCIPICFKIAYIRMPTN